MANRSAICVKCRSFTSCVSTLCCIVVVTRPMPTTVNTAPRSMMPTSAPKPSFCAVPNDTFIGRRSGVGDPAEIQRVVPGCLDLDGVPPGCGRHALPLVVRVAGRIGPARLPEPDVPAMRLGIAQVEPHVVARHAPLEEEHVLAVGALPAHMLL